MIAAAAPVPAFAASPGNLVVTASRAGGGSSSKLQLNFSGTPGSITITSVTLAGNPPTPIAVSPTTFTSPGSTTASGGQSYVSGGSYTVVFTLDNVQYTRTVPAP